MIFRSKARHSKNLGNPSREPNPDLRHVGVIFSGRPDAAIDDSHFIKNEAGELLRLNSNDDGWDCGMEKLFALRVRTKKPGDKAAVVERKRDSLFSWKI